MIWKVIAAERSTTRLVTFLEKRAQLDLKYAQALGSLGGIGGDGCGEVEVGCSSKVDTALRKTMGQITAHCTSSG